MTPTPALAPLPADLRDLFEAGPGYLSACTMGLPTRETVERLRADLTTWSAGGSTAHGYAGIVEGVRASYASLVGVPVGSVAVGSQTASFVSVLAAAVPAGAEVLCVTGDFSSLTYPFVVAEARGVVVRHVPLEELAAEIGPRTHLVAFSLVQSASGRVADVAAIREAARIHDAFTLCDTTQAAGAMPIDASLFDATACHAYKWLCAPRGAAFLTLSDRYRATLVPVQANWYAGADVWASCYGPAMALAEDARAFDVSPAFGAWVGAAPAIALFARLDLEAVHRRNVELGDLVSAGLGIEPRGQAIVTWPDADGTDLARLGAAGLVASGRAGRARIAFHVWNDEDDVERVVAALRG
ncbi:aminotransferase class V-fold PLP-dependent enzyme [Clavibacter sp. Sh2141]|uniref:aminotransferase class V-fold PLP-dependent enzyme n=1 Tax=Clavibacter sp. Sh2141 TaxID=3395374 RepID=UPI0039BCE1D7